MRTKENVYDDQINPLMAQVIAICKEHKIALVASFSIPTPDDPGLCCTTVLLDDSHLVDVPKQRRQDMLAAKSILYDGFIAFSRRVG